MATATKPMMLDETGKQIVDELKKIAEVKGSAIGTTFDDSEAHLGTNNVQGAIDKLKSNADTLAGKVTEAEQNIITNTQNIATNAAAISQQSSQIAEESTARQSADNDLNSRIDNLIISSPFITLSQLGAVENADISDILLDAVTNYNEQIIVIDKNYTCEKDIEITVSNWHIYALPDVTINTQCTLTLSNITNVRIDNLVWRDNTARSTKTGLVINSTVSNSIFNRCTIRGFKIECEINDVAYVVFNDCNFITGYESDVLVRINNYLSKLSKFNRCNFEGGTNDNVSCSIGIEIRAGVWFEFNSCNITNCETLLKMNDYQSNTRQLRFTNCTLYHYNYAVAYGNRGISSLLFAQCIFKGHDGKYTPLYLLKDARGNVVFRDCYEMTEADNYCYVNAVENYNTVIIGNFLEAKKFYSATTENVKDNIYVIVCIELTNPDTVSISKNTTSNYKQINSIGFFKPKLLWSDNNNAYKVIPYCGKPADTTCRIFFGVTSDGNTYTYAYQLCRLW